MIGLMTPHLLRSPMKMGNAKTPTSDKGAQDSKGAPVSNKKATSGFLRLPHSPYHPSNNAKKTGNAKTPATYKGAQVASGKKGNTVDKATNTDNYSISRRHSSPAALHSSPTEPEPHIQFNLDLQNNRQEKVASPDELPDPMLEEQITEEDVFAQSHHQDSKHTEVTSRDELADPMLEAQDTEAPDETLEIAQEGHAQQPNRTRAASNDMQSKVATSGIKTTTDKPAQTSNTGPVYLRMRDVISHRSKVSRDAIANNKPHTRITLNGEPIMLISQRG